jgi:hypothetical protein
LIANVNAYAPDVARTRTDGLCLSDRSIDSLLVTYRALWRARRDKVSAALTAMTFVGASEWSTVWRSPDASIQAQRELRRQQLHAGHA